MSSWYRKVVAWSRNAWAANATWFALAFALLAAVFMVVAILESVELHPRHLYVNWGTMPEWFAAVGTVGALFVAGAVWRHDVNNRRADERRRIQAEKRQQAELITAWIKMDSPAYAVVALYNASQGVVYDLQIELRFADRSPRLASGLALAFSGLKRTTARGRIAVLGPGSGTVYVARTVSAELEARSVELWFRDQRGNYWQRGDNGQLAAVNRGPFPAPTPTEALLAKMTYNPFQVEVQDLVFQPDQASRPSAPAESSPGSTPPGNSRSLRQRAARSTSVPGRPTSGRRKISGGGPGPR